MSNEIEKKASSTPSKKIPFSSFITSNAIMERINKIVGDEKSGKRFISGIVSAVSTNPDLAECDNASIFSGALLGESLNLSPSPQMGNYYLVPYNDKNKGKVATFQLGLTY